VAIIAHDGAGKTALTEALLRHDAPARAGKDGSTSHLDAEPEEAKRNFTVATHVTFAEHDGGLAEPARHRGLLRLPHRHRPFPGGRRGGLLLVSAVSGVKHQTEAHWTLALERSLPLIACVNKLDKDRASFLRALDDIEKTLKARPVALQLPIGLGDSFSGVIDLITCARTPTRGGQDGKFVATSRRTSPSSSSATRRSCAPGWWRQWRRPTTCCWRSTWTDRSPGGADPGGARSRGAGAAFPSGAGLRGAPRGGRARPGERDRALTCPIPPRGGRPGQGLARKRNPAGGARRPGAHAARLPQHGGPLRRAPERLPHLLRTGEDGQKL